jgi:hypothetical protein
MQCSESTEQKQNILLLYFLPKEMRTACGEQFKCQLLFEHYYGLFNDTFNNSDYIALNDRMNKKRVWKKSAVA